MGNQAPRKQAPHNSEDPDTYVSWEDGTTYVTTDRNAIVPPKLAKKGIASAAECPPVTLVQCLEAAVEKNADKVRLQRNRPARLS